MQHMCHMAGYQAIREEKCGGGAISRRGRPAVAAPPRAIRAGRPYGHGRTVETVHSIVDRYVEKAVDKLLNQAGVITYA